MYPYYYPLENQFMPRVFPTQENKKALGLLFSNEPIGIAYQTTLRIWQDDIKEAIAISPHLEKTIDALLALHHYFNTQGPTVRLSIQQVHLTQQTIKIIGIHPEPRAYVDSILLLKHNITNIASQLYPLIRKALEKSLYPKALALILIKASNALLLNTNNPEARFNLEKLIKIASFCSEHKATRKLLNSIEKHQYKQPMLDQLFNILNEEGSKDMIKDNVHLALYALATPTQHDRPAFFSPPTREHQSASSGHGVESSEQKLVIYKH